MIIGSSFILAAMHAILQLEGTPKKDLALFCHWFDCFVGRVVSPFPVGITDRNSMILIIDPHLCRAARCYQHRDDVIHRYPKLQHLFSDFLQTSDDISPSLPEFRPQNDEVPWETTA